MKMSHCALTQIRFEEAEKAHLQTRQWQQSLGLVQLLQTLHNQATLHIVRGDYPGLSSSGQSLMGGHSLVSVTREVLTNSH